MAARRPPAVARVLERVTKTAREYDMFASGDHVLVWVSGGPDSVCLLESLVRLRRLFRIRLSVFHMDHALRDDSAKDATYVRRLAGRHRLPFYLGQPDRRPDRKESLEMWARCQRDRAAGEVWERIGATKHADGHTLDDQAETVLMGLVLGWGLEGLGGIRPVNVALVRPLIDVTRDEVEAFCRSLRLRPRRDPSNSDTRLLRNAIRLEAIPAIERSTGREVRRTFARAADHLRRDGAVLWAEADEHARRLVRPRDGGFSIGAKALDELSAAMRGRVVRRAFQLSNLFWTEEAIDAVLDLAAGRPGRRRDLVLGSVARRDRTRVHVER
jgi:tRNA(Ile)-lysidine synthase